MDGDDPKVSYVFDTTHYDSTTFEFRFGQSVSISEDLGIVGQDRKVRIRSSLAEAVPVAACCNMPQRTGAAGKWRLTSRTRLGLWAASWPLI